MSDENVMVTKVGRPPKGDRPMTVRERKHAQRARDRRQAIDAIGDEHHASLRALLANLARVADGDDARHVAQWAWVEIGRRYGFVIVT